MRENVAVDETPADEALLRDPPPPTPAGPTGPAAPDGARRHPQRPMPAHVRYGPYAADILLLGGGGFTLLILTGAVARSWGFVDTEDGLGLFVMGLFNLVLAVAATFAGGLAIARRKWAFA
ncbi:MAG: hypothetical protein ACREKH_07810, partial [Candidatus Rokuibacteriota bacterium]